MLHNLIASMISSTTDDPRLRTSLVVFDRDRIFADVFEPYVFECAVAIAVHTFGLVFADDGVFEGGAGFEEEYCVGFACGYPVRKSFRKKQGHRGYEDKDEGEKVDWKRESRTSFRLTATGASAAVVASPFAVVGGAGLDGDDFAVCLCGSGFGDTASVAVAGECDGQKSREEEFDAGDHDECRECGKEGM